MSNTFDTLTCSSSNLQFDKDNEMLLGMVSDKGFKSSCCSSSSYTMESEESNSPSSTYIIISSMRSFWTFSIKSTSCLFSISSLIGCKLVSSFRLEFYNVKVDSVSCTHCQFASYVS